MFFCNQNSDTISFFVGVETRRGWRAAWRRWSSARRAPLQRNVRRGVFAKGVFFCERWRGVVKVFCVWRREVIFLFYKDISENSNNLSLLVAISKIITLACSFFFFKMRLCGRSWADPERSPKRKGRRRKRSYLNGFSPSPVFDFPILPRRWLSPKKEERESPTSAQCICPPLPPRLLDRKTSLPQRRLSPFGCPMQHVAAAWCAQSNFRSLLENITAGPFLGLANFHKEIGSQILRRNILLHLRIHIFTASQTWLQQRS